MSDTLRPIKIAGLITWASIASFEIISAGWSLRGLEFAVGFVVFIAIYFHLASGIYDKRLIAGRIGMILMWLVLYYLVWRIQDLLIPILYVVWGALLGRFIPARFAKFAILISCSFLFLAFVNYLSIQDALVQTGLNFSFQFFTLSASLARVSEKQSREKAEALNTQLLAAQALLAQHSQQEERLRIARDLHDILGHQLTGLSLHLEILQHKVPDAFKNDVQKTQDIAKNLLEKIRQVVRAQRDSAELDIRLATETLFDDLPQISGKIHGDLKVKSSALADDLLLCIREAVSNAIRHGAATEIRIQFIRAASVANQAPQTITLVIEDNGKGFQDNVQMGSGLRGMKERLKMHQGDLVLVSTATKGKSGARLELTCIEKLQIDE